MQQSGRFNRRDFLRLSGIGAAALVAGPALSSCDFVRRALSPSPDVEIALQAVPGEVNILPGRATRVWQYQGKVTRGDPNSLQTMPGSYLGPVFRLRKGQRVRIVFTNNLPQQSIVHWHGLKVPDDMDGHPRFAIAPGKTYEYEYQVINRAGTYWYHPHPDMLTGPQVYNGMAGLFLVSDDEESAAGLPAGEFDVPLVIQDRSFDDQNQLVYMPGGTNDQTMGFLGDRIMVNGHPDYTLEVATRPYRLRILNGSNSRVYKLGWQDGTPLTVIGTDGGLLEKPVSKPYVTLAPAERVELWVDFSGRVVGTELQLQSLTFNGLACAAVSSLGG
jgi:blue copper oxidase